MLQNLHRGNACRIYRKVVKVFSGLSTDFWRSHIFLVSSWHDRTLLRSLRWSSSIFHHQYIPCFILQKWSRDQTSCSLFVITTQMARLEWEELDFFVQALFNSSFTFYLFMKWFGFSCNEVMSSHPVHPQAKCKNDGFNHLSLSKYDFCGMFVIWLGKGC